jgi:hypothetical protein
LLLYRFGANWFYRAKVLSPYRAAQVTVGGAIVLAERLNEEALNVLAYQVQL